MYVLKASAILLAMSCYFSFLDGAPATTTSTTTAQPTDVCKICKEMVAEARETLASNETMDEMRQVFEGTCRILVPIKSLAKLCAKYADELVPVLVQTLYDEMDPTKVCVTSGLCYATGLQGIMASLKSVNDDFVKSITKVLMETDRETFITLAENVDFPDERVQNLLKGLCYLLPERERTGECVDSVSLYYNIVKSFLATQLKSGSDCDICKLAVSYFESEILQPSSEKALESLLLEICPHVGQYEVECNAFIKQYFAKLWSILVNAVKEQTICKDIGLCTSQGLGKMKPEAKIDECTICKDLIAEAKTELLSDEIVNGAQSYAISLCEFCSTKDECVKYLDKNFVKFYKGIVSQLDPVGICKSLGVCPSSSASVKLPITLNRVRLTKQVLTGDFPVESGNEVECTICKYVVHFIQGELVQNKSIEFIKHGLKEICKRLPSVGEECMAFVDTYAAAIAQLLAHEMDPNNVCYKLTNICSAMEGPSLLPVKPLKVTKCSVCQMAVGYMDHLLQDNELGVNLSDLVETVCKMMPKSTTKQCIDIVSNFGPRLIPYIGAAANSREVCQFVSICPKVVHLLGEKKCSYGPAYWCQDMSHAQECNAVKHCVERVWGKQIT